MDFVAPGLLGQNFYQFRGEFFVAHGKIPDTGQQFDWRLRPSKREELMQRLKTKSVFMAKEDCLDLPEKVFVVRKAQMPSDLRTKYNTMIKDHILPLVEDRFAIGANVLAEITKLRQLSGGHIFDTAGKPLHLSDYKLELLDSVLEEVGNQQVVIWAQFRHEVRKIRNRLEPHATFAVGGMNPKDLLGNLHRFKAGDFKYLVAHPACIGHGTTLTNASYMIYYSLSYSLEEFIQSQERIHRIGQQDKCTYFSLLAEDSIDETIYKALVKKEVLSSATLAYLKAQAG